MRRVDVPLFNGYAFCRFDATNRLPILKAPGVVNIVGFGTEFIAIPVEEIEAVRAIAASHVLARPWPYLTVGEPVRIARGPLSGVEGILIDVKKKHRLIVSVHLLQRSVAAEVSLACVERSLYPSAPPYRSEGLNPRP